MSGDEPAFYEDLVPRVKARDGFSCVRKCGRKPPEDKLRVVRRNPSTPDSMWNLETVCRWCAPDWE